jgi:hypothetical protein
LFLSLPINMAGQPLLARRSAAVATSPESEAIVAAWSLPSLINEQSTQMITWCVQAAFEVSQWSRTLTGTLTWSSAGAVTYRPMPRDRLRVNYANGRTVDFVISEIQGYPNEGPDELLNRDYRISCRAFEKGMADLTMHATRTGRVTGVATIGSVVFAGISYGVNAQIKRDTYFESSSGGAEYRNETVLQGSITGSSFDLTLDDKFLFQLVSFEGRSASGSRRITNSQWRLATQRYAFEKGIFARSDTNGRPAHVNTEWGVAGGIQRNNQRWGALTSRLNGNFFEVWATLPNGEIKLAAIPLS